MMRKSVVIVLALTAFTVPASDAEARRTGKVRTEAIDMVVVHSTGGPTCDVKTGKPIWVRAGTLEENMRNIEADLNLGIHYMIDRDGTLRASVPKGEAVHHVFATAGALSPSSSLTTGTGTGAILFPNAQLASLVKLLRDIKQRRGITRDGIKRHSDLDHALLPCDKTQRRKVDPGTAFPYKLILDRVFQPQQKSVEPDFKLEGTAARSLIQPLRNRNTQ